MKNILVTGGTGFVAGHCILRLLQHGYDVRTTVRNLDREEEVRTMIKNGGITEDLGDRLKFFIADLENDEGWAAAMNGCDGVLHIACSVPLTALPHQEQEYVRGALEQTLRVLRIAKDASVKRFVLTSSVTTINFGHPHQDAAFDETTWTSPGGEDVLPYMRAKLLSERAAWGFIATEGQGMEFVVLNPGSIFGPVLGPHFSNSLNIIQRMMDGAMPGCPAIHMGIVDVRDFADLQVVALTHPQAAGERFIAVEGKCLSLVDIANTLKENLGEAAKKVPTNQVPSWLVKIAAAKDAALSVITPQLDKIRHATSAKARQQLNWTTRSAKETLTDSAKSLQHFGLLKRGD